MTESTWQSDLPKPTAAPISHDADQTPTSWLDSRLGLAEFRANVINRPVPKYVQFNLLYSLGGLSLISFLFQMMSGLALIFYYVPSITDAYNSVDYITYQAPLGWLIRGIHHYNASAIIILVVLHLLRTFFFSTYKRPRELTWLSGVALLLVSLGFGFTGYLLPWDQRGYWASKIATEITALVPGIGETLASMLRGGSTLGQLTLSRFYVIHVALLPIAMAAMLALHISQHRRHGAAPSILPRDAALANQRVPAYPNGHMLDVLLGLGLLALLVLLSWQLRAPLEFPADPSSTDYNPRPEWYFLFLFQLLHYAPGFLEPILIVIVPLVVIGSMLILPFVDRSPERRPWRKPITTAIALFYLAVIVAFTVIGLINP